MDVAGKARNQALFRDVNERVATLNREWGSLRPFEAFCECGSAGCTRRITLTMGAYERIRSSPLLFVVVPGHDDSAVERVVETLTDYAVVENVGVAADVARATDPSR